MSIEKVLFTLMTLKELLPMDKFNSVIQNALEKNIITNKHVELLNKIS